MKATIDGATFARDRASLAGTLVVENLAAPTSESAARLVSSGVLSGRIEWRLSGIETERGKPGLRVEANGVVALECQRCLEPVEHAVAVDVELELAPDQAAVDAAEDEIDRVAASRAMDVAALVEDEVLLDLPMVPRHEDCAPKARSEEHGGALAGLLSGWKRGDAGPGGEQH